jgi:hypothetical protein
VFLFVALHHNHNNNNYNNSSSSNNNNNEHQFAIRVLQPKKLLPEVLERGACTLLTPPDVGTGMSGLLCRLDGKLLAPAGCLNQRAALARARALLTAAGAAARMGESKTRAMLDRPMGVRETNWNAGEL